MENIEIILVDFQKNMLDKFITERLINNLSIIKSSHFYNSALKQDFELHEIKNISKLLMPIGTGNIVFSQLNFGICIKDVVTIISFDEVYGDIVFNFREQELLIGDVKNIRNRINILINFLLKLKCEYNLSNIKVGFEPAFDNDMLIFELNKGFIDVDKVISEIINM